MCDEHYEHDHRGHGGEDRDRRRLLHSKRRYGKRLRTCDRVVANPMWKQAEFKENDYDFDELGLFPKVAFVQLVEERILEFRG
jgi:hypothetical protein